jgi:hypothetical protein
MLPSLLAGHLQTVGYLSCIRGSGCNLDFLSKIIGKYLRQGLIYSAGHKLGALKLSVYPND